MNSDKLSKIKNEDLELDDFSEDDYLNEETANTDELSNAMDYFDSMAKREKEKQKILNKTYRNRNANTNSNININSNEHLQLNNLSLNIPYQLKQSTTNNNDNDNSVDRVASAILDDLPYGCLKGGTKPTYKTWMNSVKNYSSMSNTDIIKPPTPPKKRQIETFTEKEYKESLLEEPDKHKENILKKQINDRLKKIENEQNIMNDDNIEVTPFENANNKQYIKKIIKKKYTLGKSSKYRKVGVLIKGRQTKKNIISSHKKLKNTNIHQIKKYLKKHGMLKAGSSCPDEILRKIYESAMLSGEINNTNKNTLIHNFLNDDETIR
jgi:hypothetical protein